MSDSIPILVVLVVIVFAATSVLTYVGLEEVTEAEPDVIEEPVKSAVAGGYVKVEVLQPEVENEANLE